MAVPTMYEKLISFWNDLPEKNQKSIKKQMSYLRLMVSGSDALLPNTLRQWKTITGHVLLERYGMTEVGMALSNPLNGKRIPGSWETLYLEFKHEFVQLILTQSKIL